MFWSLLYGVCYPLMQLARQRRLQHEENLQQFENQLDGLEHWLASSKLDHAGDTMISYDIPYLQQQIEANKVLYVDLLIWTFSCHYVPFLCSYRTEIRNVYSILGPYMYLELD